MWIRVSCEKCGAVLEYQNKSVCEGNRDSEDVKCPVCKNVVGSVFTDLIPEVRLVKE